MSALELKVYETSETKEDIGNIKADLIKWMFGLWVTQMAAIIGLYFRG